MKMNLNQHLHGKNWRDWEFLPEGEHELIIDSWKLTENNQLMYFCVDSQNRRATASFNLSNSYGIYWAKNFAQRIAFLCDADFDDFDFGSLVGTKFIGIVQVDHKENGRWHKVTDWRHIGEQDKEI